MAHETSTREFEPGGLEPRAADLDALLDLAMYALRGMALDGHVATKNELHARVELISEFVPYLEQARGNEQ